MDAIIDRQNRSEENAPPTATSPAVGRVWHGSGCVGQEKVGGSRVAVPVTVILWRNLWVREQRNLTNKLAETKLRVLFTLSELWLPQVAKCFEAKGCMF